MAEYKVELTFTEELLGTVAKDKDIYTNFIASKGENTADELETVPDPEQGVTGFHSEALSFIEGVLSSTANDAVQLEGLRNRISEKLSYFLNKRKIDL